jgi:hypothetical protein
MGVDATCTAIALNRVSSSGEVCGRLVCRKLEQGMDIL